jgi:hypothetical protein
VTFIASEADDLAEAIKFSLQLGWDAYLAAQSGRHCFGSRMTTASKSIADLNGDR